MSGAKSSSPYAAFSTPAASAQNKTLPSNFQGAAKEKFTPPGAENATALQATILVEVNKDQETQIVKSAQMWQNSLYSQFALRGEFENIDRQYLREADWTDEQVKARLANRKGDSTKFQNITVPIILTQVRSALTYLQEVFLSGYPIFPIVSDPANEDAAIQMETIVNENATRTGWAQQLSLFFRDGLKYNLHAIECSWEQRVNWTIENDVKAANSAGAKKVLWEGNVIRRMDLYNTFWDPRVHPTQMHSEGEFVGYTEVLSRVRFKAYMNSLYNKVPVNKIVDALNSQPVQGAIGASLNAPFGYYIPIVNPFPFFNKTASLDWMNWATNTPMDKLGVDYKNAYTRTIIYARIIPSDFGFAVPAKNTPQVWKFIIINGAVVLSAERLTNVHNYIPIFFGQPDEDGLDYQTKSFAQNVSDFQGVSSAMMNAYIASKRRLVTDRVLYDPSRISKEAINSDNPAAKIPVRQSAYGKPIGEAVYQFPFRDEQADSLVNGQKVVFDMANMVNGQNPAAQGQFVKGNKTRREYDDVMGHGNGFNRSMALATENQVFTPLKEVILLNTLQYQQAKDIYNTGRGKTVSVDPVELRKTAVHFKVSDGFVPAEKQTGDDVLQTGLQQIGSSPQLAAEYNIGPLFSYFMKTEGFDISAFEKSPEQKQYEQALQVWQNAAMQAAKSGAAFSTPMPQPSPALKQQQQQQGNAGNPSVAASALESTQS